MSKHDSIRAVQWRDDRLILLDQRRLPAEEVFCELASVNEVANAIRDMVVRGAPAIGITAAYGVVIAATQRIRNSPEKWQQEISEDLALLAASRPTAVNLIWALEKMQVLIESAGDDPINELLAAAKQIHQQDVEANHRMGATGAQILGEQLPGEQSSVLTHCNTGSLATGGYGTALGVIRCGYSEGKIKYVYADETRPWLQGSRLTAWELKQDNIPVTLVADSAAASLMAQGKVQWVIVGADRITANGDVANKIGTYSLAVNARHHGVKMMVVAPTSTIDMNTATGKDIPIEQRDASEILSISDKNIAPEGVNAWNPSFDVTPAELIDVIITERGAIQSPNPDNVMALMKNAQ